MQLISNKKGFTILELLVVLAVMGVFTAIAYPNISSWITDREVKKEVYETHFQGLKNILKVTYQRLVDTKTKHGTH